MTDSRTEYFRSYVVRLARWIQDNSIKKPDNCFKRESFYQEAQQDYNKYLADFIIQFHAEGSIIEMINAERHFNDNVRKPKIDAEWLRQQEEANVG